MSDSISTLDDETDDFDGYGYDDDPSCTWCGGDAWTECDDPIQCCDPKCDGQTHQCPACRGTGLGENQVLW